MTEAKQLSVNDVYLYCRNTRHLYQRGRDYAHRFPNNPKLWLLLVEDCVRFWRSEFRRYPEDNIAELALELWGVAAKELRDFFIEHVKEG